MAAKFNSMQIQNSKFVAVIDQFTTHTYILVVASVPGNCKFNICSSLINNKQSLLMYIHFSFTAPTLISRNIESARKRFEHIEQELFEQEEDVQNDEYEETVSMTDSKDSDDTE